MEWAKQLLTIGSSQWYETLPSVTAFLFVTIDLIARMWHRRPFSRKTPYEMLFVGGEGASIGVIATYAPALLFYKDLAAQIASKNDKILSFEMICAFIAITQHFYDGWKGEH